MLLGGFEGNPNISSKHVCFHSELLGCGVKPFLQCLLGCEVPASESRCVRANDSIPCVYIFVCLVKIHTYPGKFYIQKNSAISNFFSVSY